MKQIDILNECKLCPRNCRVNRNNYEKGFCRQTNKIRIALSSIHKFEEPCISKETGSGTVFFSGCNLKCKYCQNYEISQENYGKEISILELANQFLNLQKLGANNINLVTGFAFVPQIIESLKIAKKQGLKIPIIYNTSGYESVETLKMLEGYIDVYLPDFKYYYNELAIKLSDANNYFEIAKEAISEMFKQVGYPKFDEKGIIKKGVIIRHLILPNHIQNTKMILKYIKKYFGKRVYISIMAQYFPAYKAKDLEDINRKITKEELQEVKNFLEKLDFKNGFIQDLEEEESKYVPKFKN